MLEEIEKNNGIDTNIRHLGDRERSIKLEDKNHFRIYWPTDIKELYHFKVKLVQDGKYSTYNCNIYG